MLPALRQQGWSGVRTDLNAKMAINYGLNKVRFKNPVPAGSRVRMRSVLLQAQKRAGALQVVLENTLEVEGQDKPAFVAEVIALYFLAEA